MLRSAIGLGLALLAGACVAEVEMPLDVDEDGLLDIEEDELGTDPLVADSDGDGILTAEALEVSRSISKITRILVGTKSMRIVRTKSAPKELRSAW